MRREDSIRASSAWRRLFRPGMRRLRENSPASRLTTANTWKSRQRSRAKPKTASSASASKPTMPASCAIIWPVFLDGRGLSTEHMQDLACEMNLSETTFILPGDAATEKTRGVRVRIFTVQEELPFAGHPTLGTAFVMRGQTGADEV